MWLDVVYCCSACYICFFFRLFAAYGQYRKTLFSAGKLNHPRYTWGGGDSVDRERVRDMMLSLFPNCVQYVHKPYRTLSNY